MVAVTSLLDSNHTLLVNELIVQLEREFNLSEVQTTPYPHLTFLTTQVNNLQKLKNYLEQFAENMPAFTARTTGLGIFPGEKPVIYIPILRSDELNRFHAELYQNISAFSEETGHYYNPNLWMPHITLALGDTNPLILGSILNYLNRFTFDWEIQFNNLAILTRSGDKYLKDDIFKLREPEAVQKN